MSMFERNMPAVSYISMVSSEMSHACDFQQCGILTSVDSDQPVQPPFRHGNSNDVQSEA